MKKLVILFSILFVLFTVSAKETGKELKIEEFKYRPYKASEFVFDSIATIVGVGMVAGISLGLGFEKREVADGDLNLAPLVGIGVLNLLGPMVGSMGILVSGVLHESQGNFLAGLAGGYTMALPFFATAFLFDGELFPFVGLGSALIIPGVMVGFAASRKTRLYSARALMMNVFGTVLGGFSGMVTYYSTINSDIDRQSIVHAVPAIFLTLGGTTLTYLISRYAIVDEPDNAGTWLGVLGGTALGALTGFGIGTIWKYGGRDSYLAGITTAFVIGGAIMGELIGFAASHTTMPDRKIMSKEKKVSVSILPPMMVPERIPMSNKTFKRWMILNAGLSF